jgi:transketolase
MALSAKISKKDYKVYTMLGDGEISEGQVWEALMFANAKKLDNLCVIIDNNDLQIDGSLEEVNSPYPIDEKLKAFGFEVKVIDGHDFNEIKEAFDIFEKGAEKPFAIIAKTTKGKGISFMENKCDWHGVAPNEEQYKMAMAELEGGEI